MAISDKPANRRAATPPNTDVGDLFVRKFNVVEHLCGYIDTVGGWYCMEWHQNG